MKCVFCFVVPLVALLHPARMGWGTYLGCCSQRDGARHAGQDRELGRPHTLSIIPK